MLLVRGPCIGPIVRPEVLPIVVCLSVIVKPRQKRGLDTQEAVESRVLEGVGWGGGECGEHNV